MPMLQCDKYSIIFASSQNRQNKTISGALSQRTTNQKNIYINMKEVSLI